MGLKGKDLIFSTCFFSEFCCGKDLVSRWLAVVLHVYYAKSGMIVATKKAGVCYTFGHNFGMATIEIALQVQVQSIQVRGFPEKIASVSLEYWAPHFETHPSETVQASNVQ